MLGLINRAIQCFLRDTYGIALWEAVVRHAELAADGFEPMLQYEIEETERLIASAASVLERPREAVLEDLGTYLVSHHNVEALRRLLRFGGVTFTEFLHSLEDLQDRGRLALPDLELPSLSLEELGMDNFRLTCRSRIPGAGHVVMGLLRAMADDYGALVLMDHLGQGDDGEKISILLLDAKFAVGRRFDLGARVV